MVVRDGKWGGLRGSGGFKIEAELMMGMVGRGVGRGCNGRNYRGGRSSNWRRARREKETVM